MPQGQADTGKQKKNKKKVKGKVRPRTGHKDPEGKQNYSCTFSLTAKLDLGGWLTSRPGRFTHGKETRVTIVWEARWTSRPVWTSAENLAPQRDSIPGPSSP